MTTQPLSGLPDPKTDAQFYEGVPFKRLLAWIIDLLVVLSLTVVLMILTVGIYAFWAFAGWFLLSFVYRVLTLSGGSATLGMRLVGIEIRNSEGDLLSGSEALGHTALYSLIFIIPFGTIVNVILMLVNERGQGLHDLFLGSTAINRPI